MCFLAQRRKICSELNALSENEIYFGRGDNYIISPYVSSCKSSHALLNVREPTPTKDLIVERHRSGNIMTVITCLWFRLRCDINSAGVLRVCAGGLATTSPQLMKTNTL